MIKIENAEVLGWEHAIRGMRNPMDSWSKSDSISCHNIPCSKCHFFVDSHCVSKKPGGNFAVGKNDHELMMKLAKGGSVHAKFRRMITVYFDISAPLYWLKQLDTYKVGTVWNSTSTMHKIHEKEFSIDDFSHEHLDEVTTCHNIELHGAFPEKTGEANTTLCNVRPIDILQIVVDALNVYRDLYLKTKDKVWWNQMIQLLPSSYHWGRTVMLNYEVLSAIYRDRKNHKLGEWRTFCDWIKTLPYSELITGGNADE